MSQPATERETKPQPGKSGGKGLSKKIGPLPAWAWAALAGGGALVWYVLRKRKNSQQAASAASSGGACTDANGNPGTLDSAGNCVPAAVIYQGGSAGAAPGTMCKDASGNPGFVNANGDCDTSLAGTGLPGGGQDAALLAQIKNLQGQESAEAKTVTDIQSDVGEPPARRPRPPLTEEQRETPAQEARENRRPPRPRPPSSNWPGGRQPPPPRPIRPRPQPLPRPRGR